MCHWNFDSTQFKRDMDRARRQVLKLTEAKPQPDCRMMQRKAKASKGIRNAKGS